MADDTQRPDALLILRGEFPPENIGKLPKITCPDCRDRKCSKHLRANCKGCGNYLTTAHIHIDYVGHAEVTDRLLDADLRWNWRPMAFDDRGLPLFDEFGGLWMYLTVGGVERPGYGSANGKKGPDAIKEIIGDALRNSGMRFGVALNQWAKSDLHADEHDGDDDAPVTSNGQRLRLANDPNHVSPQQMVMISSLFNRREITDDAERGRIVADIIGRTIGGMFQLTPTEASLVIQKLTADVAEAGA